MKQAQPVNAKTLQTGKSYKLKPLPMNTPKTVLIDIINLLGLHLADYDPDRLDIKAFIKRYPDLLEEL